MTKVRPVSAEASYFASPAANVALSVYEAWPFSCTARPQSAAVSGPALTDGFTFETLTVRLCVVDRPVTSVTVSWPSWEPLSPNARRGFGPKDFVPFESSHTYESIGHCEA